MKILIKDEETNQIFEIIGATTVAVYLRNVDTHCTTPMSNDWFYMQFMEAMLATMANTKTEQQVLGVRR